MTPRDEPTYRLDVRIADRWAEIALVAEVGGSDRRPVDVWSHRFDSVATAGRIVGPMVALRKEWDRWGRMGALLGSDFLDGVMDGDLLGVVTPGDARRRSERSATLARSFLRPGGKRIGMRLLVGNGTSCITGRRDGRLFMRLVLPTSIQARRVWDWLRWQTDRYPGMFEFSKREGAPALIVLIVADVLDAERRAMLVPGPRDPERPLRHWRPADHAGGIDASDAGPDEAFG